MAELDSFDYIVDVRTAPEFEARHYTGAINWDLQLMMKGSLPKLPQGAHIGLYCNSGNRSEIARRILSSSGFTNLDNLGGLEDIT